MTDRARVFISCGQDKATDEVGLAHKIREELESLGFEAYIAVREQVLVGVKENIFAQLAASEYFLFIDFRRERLAEGGDCRGSLFSHQELAVAAHLGVQVLAFQEEGVRKQDGLLRYLQTNCIPFTDRSVLPEAVKSEVTSREWRPDWKRGLLVDFRHWSDAPGADGMARRDFQVGVLNQHRVKPARNCVVYLALVRHLDLKTGMYFAPMELHWSGHPFPNALVAPKWWRTFDAFTIRHDRPGRADFEGFTTARQFQIPPIEKRSAVHLSYAVISDDFPIAVATFELQLGTSLDAVKFAKVDLDQLFKQKGWHG